MTEQEKLRCEICGYPLHEENQHVGCPKCESDAPEGDACWTGV